MSAERATLCRRCCALLAILGAVTVPVASAALYKWVDANGRTVYSDQPPTGNVKSDLVNPAAPNANPTAAKELAQKEAEFRKRQTDKADDAKKAEKAQSDKDKLTLFCNQARVQAAGLRRTDVPMYRLNDKGDRVVMDEAARKAEIARLDQLVKEQKCL
ncbi:MAG TPA: DUF4124 domain-containing protein [Casimicrobiaceae bacterium]|nr:DUF4124 domain-containing protein [Casimicrobiaceae bacterium]